MCSYTSKSVSVAKNANGKRNFKVSFVNEKRLLSDGRQVEAASHVP